MKLPIYLDYAATTPVDPRVVERMVAYLGPDGVFGNPASRSHEYGWQAEEAVDRARHDVAALIGADPREIIWTSGATESDNLALIGAARMHRDRGRHIITSQTEHKAVLDTCQALEAEGFEVTYLPPEPDGLLDLNRLADAIRPDTLLISVMHVNNELGVVQDLAAIGELVRERPILFHVDAAQSAGKLPIDVHAWGIDLLSLSAHKVYGPKGVGALYVRRRPRLRLEPLIHGGGHERGLRSGTLPTHQIVGMGDAYRIAAAEMAEESPRVAQLRDRLWQGIRHLDGVRLNGHLERRAPGILNVSFEGVEGEALLLALRDLAVSSGSACTSASIETSHVLRAIGRSEALAQSTIRFSLGRFTTAEEIDHAVHCVCDRVTRLRSLDAVPTSP